jgi:maleate isomerase
MDLNRDNWGHRARFGMFIVGSEAVPEAEWWAMIPPDVSVHAARVTAKAPWASWSSEHNVVELSLDLSIGLKQFASMKLDSIVIGHSSSSFIGGKGWDEAIVRQLSEALDDTVAVTTNGLDIFAAITELRLQRPFLVLPAWFGQATIEAALKYYRDHDVELAGHLSYDPGPNWSDIPPAEMYPRGAGFDQEVIPLYGQIVVNCPDNADGVLIAGTGFRCVAILDALERSLKRPVVSANQASLWHCLRLAKVDATIDGYGRLLSQ